VKLDRLVAVRAAREPAKEVIVMLNGLQERRDGFSPAAMPKVSHRASGGQIVCGYAAVYYVASDPGSTFQLYDNLFERLIPGCFDRAIREDDCRALMNHNPDFILGRTTSGTCRLKSDAKGLWYEIDVGKSALAQHAAEAVQRRDVSGSSFSFIATDTVWRDERDPEGNKYKIREIHEAMLFDVGPVSFPAYTSTTAGMRDALDRERLSGGNGRDWKTDLRRRKQLLAELTI
jgi:HK97 family phage prohead protease